MFKCNNMSLFIILKLKITYKVYIKYDMDTIEKLKRGSIKPMGVKYLFLCL